MHDVNKITKRCTIMGKGKDFNSKYHSMDDDTVCYVVMYDYKCKTDNKKTVVTEYLGYSHELADAMMWGKSHKNVYAEQGTLYIMAKNVDDCPLYELGGKEIQPYYFNYNSFTGEEHVEFLTEDEFTYWSEAWYQYLSELVSYKLARFTELVNVLRLDKKEQKKINKMLEILTEFARDYNHGLINDDEAQYTYFNYKNIFEYFINVVL